MRTDTMTTRPVGPTTPPAVVPPMPSVRAYLMADEICDVMMMSPWEKRAWVEDHPYWRDHLEAFEQVVKYEDAMTTRQVGL